MGLLDILTGRAKKEAKAEEEAKRLVEEEERQRALEELKHKDEIITYVDQFKVNDQVINYALFTLNETYRKDETFLIKGIEELDMQSKMDNISSLDETWKAFLTQLITSLSNGNQPQLLPKVGLFEVDTYVQIVIFNSTYEKTGLDLHKGKVIEDHFVKAKIVNFDPVKLSYLIK